MLAPHPSERRFTIHADALIRIDLQGCINSLEEAREADGVPETWPGTVLVPGFVDTHLHFPQVRILGSASGPLLPWLQTSVFPEEARFSDRSYAEEVAVEFCDAMLAQGTTCAGIYSSSDWGATDALFAELDRRGMRALAGPTLMNRGASEAVLRDAGRALEAAEDLVQRWHGHDDDRLRFCVTPRFALGCDAELMRGAVRLAARHGLWLQTHLSENRDELVRTAELFPEATDYLNVYENCGLPGPQAIFAHCIHLSDDEWQRLARHRATVAHCPDSNFFLGSGCMPLAAALERGMRVGLGTDVGAGRTFSMRRVAASAYDAALIAGASVQPEELLWLATRGGAMALGLEECVGCLAPGFKADLVAIDVPETSSAAQLIDALVFRHDAGPVRATIIQGRLRWSMGS